MSKKGTSSGCIARRGGGEDMNILLRSLLYFFTLCSTLWFPKIDWSSHYGADRISKRCSRPSDGVSVCKSSYRRGRVRTGVSKTAWECIMAVCRLLEINEHMVCTKNPRWLVL
jgi:hypothetical protein